MIEIRPAVAGDLPALVRTLGGRDPERHGLRLELQESGCALYLLALDAGEPVGHALLKWTGCSDERVRRHLDVGSCPDVEDLRVLPTRRRAGIGTRLMEEAAARVAARGFPRLGVGVGTWNAIAWALYEKLGYREAGVPPFKIGASGVDESGEPWSWQETVAYLVKALS